jgi:hypothetical protein
MPTIRGRAAAVADVAGKPGRRGVTLVCCAAACAVAAGCSSSPSPSAQTQAQTARATVQPAAKQLYTQATAAGIGWIGSIVGGYAPCGTDDPLATGKGTNSLQYTASELMTPYDESVPYATFKRQVVEALGAEGWALRPGAGSAGQASYYTAQRDSLQLWLIEAAGQPSHGPTASIYLSGTCFAAGASGEQLVKTSPDEDIPEPSPTATPAPRYS